MYLIGRRNGIQEVSLSSLTISEAQQSRETQQKKKKKARETAQKATPL